MVVLRVSCWVFVDVGDGLVVMVVFWSGQLLLRVDEWVYFGAHSQRVEVVDVEDVEFLHDRGGVGSVGKVDDESDDFLVDFVERMEVGFAGFGRSPDGDAVDEVGVDVAVVLFFHSGG